MVVLLGQRLRFFDTTLRDGEQTPGVSLTPQQKLEIATALSDIGVDVVFIGSCTNGRFEDLAVAAEVLGKKKFSPKIRVIIIPASRDEYLKTLKAGLIEKFVKAGALVEAPCCGPCMGGAFGLIAPGEVSLATSNRNFKGRQGSTEGKVYLCSPATAAASAITGEITDPREV